MTKTIIYVASVNKIAIWFLNLNDIYKLKMSKYFIYILIIKEK